MFYSEKIKTENLTAKCWTDSSLSRYRISIFEKAFKLNLVVFWDYVEAVATDCYFGPAF